MHLALVVLCAVTHCQVGIPLKTYGKLICDLQNVRMRISNVSMQNVSKQIIQLYLFIVNVTMGHNEIHDKILHVH